MSTLMVCFSFVHQSASLAGMDGLTLAKKVYERDDGADSSEEMEMILIDKRGNERLRSLVTANKDFGTLTKRYTRFTSPASIDGSGFLSWEKEDGDDDQFLYLPALRRVRRIVAKQKTNRFVNSDFTYEDQQRRKVDMDDHKILGSDTYNNYECWILGSIPKESSNSQYGKRVSWIAKDIYVTLKIEFYDKKNRLTKVYTVRDLKNIDGIWTTMETEMHDFERKHRTLMKTLAIQYNKGIPDKVFTRRYLEHHD
jgi:hypothetical protein